MVLLEMGLMPIMNHEGITVQPAGWYGEATSKESYDEAGARNGLGHNYKIGFVDKRTKERVTEIEMRVKIKIGTASLRIALKVVTTMLLVARAKPKTFGSKARRGLRHPKTVSNVCNGWTCLELLSAERGGMHLSWGVNCLNRMGPRLA